MSCEATLKKKVLELERTVLELQRAREKERAKVESTRIELQRTRSELQHRDKELRSALVRADAQRPTSAASGPASSRASLASRLTLVEERASDPAQQPQGRSPRRAALSRNRQSRSAADDDQVKTLRETVACQERDLHRAASEIEVLARALEHRAEDLGVDGNLKTGLLYQVGLFQRETHRLELALAKSEAELAKRDKEKARAVASARAAEQALKTTQEQVGELLEERQVILDYLRESSANSSKLEARVAQLTAERDEALQRERDARERERQANALLASSQRVGAGSFSEAANGGLRHEVLASPGDSLFDRLLRETESEIRAGAAASDLRNKVAALNDKVRGLEDELRHEKARSELLEEELGQAHKAARSAELRRETDAFELARQERAASREAGFRETVQSEPGSGGPANAAQMAELEALKARLQSQLKVAGEAREFAENEAIRLEAENAKLRQQLRSNRCPDCESMRRG